MTARKPHAMPGRCQPAILERPAHSVSWPSYISPSSLNSQKCRHEPRRTATLFFRTLFHDNRKERLGTKPGTLGGNRRQNRHQFSIPVVGVSSGKPHSRFESSSRSGDIRSHTHVGPGLRPGQAATRPHSRDLRDLYNRPNFFTACTIDFNCSITAYIECSL